MKSRKRLDMKAVKNGDAAKMKGRPGTIIQRVIPGLETSERVDPKQLARDLERLQAMARRACSG
jgi:hypothetical protein